MHRTAGLAATAVLTTAATLTAVTAATAPAGAAPGSATADQRGPAAAALAALAEHPGAARAAQGQGFAVRGALRDADGGSHVRVDRTWRGLPVRGGDMVVHLAPGEALDGVSQTLDAPLDVTTRPGLGRGAALGRVLGQLGGMKALRKAGAPTLVVDAHEAQPRLAWEVRTTGVRADGTPSALTTYVDAVTGATLRTDEQVQTVDGDGQTLYSGDVPLQLTQASGGYEVRDATRGGTYTIDVDHAEDGFFCSFFGSGCATGPVVSGPDTSFGDGTNADPQTAAADAQYGTNETWDYYEEVHGRDGIFGDGSGSFNRVHYGTDYVNAFWDGEKMTFGDGDGVDFGPLVSLDVTGHEMSHGVTENTANLTYSGESGGLNEATSDIFGTMVEFHAANAADPGDYLIGEEFDLANHRGFRRMDQPSSDGSSYDCYSSGIGNADVHYSSGLGNHFFYLLAEGSGAKTIGGVQHSSTTCDGSSVAGIGREAAADIWYRALTAYMTSGTDYAGARDATINAAQDLYGAGSTQADAVAATWSAVGVG